MTSNRFGAAGLPVLFLFLLTSLNGQGQVRINEVMANNKGAVVNGATSPDYVELYNTGGAAVNIGGWSLTDNTNTPAKYVFPINTTLLGKSYLVVYCDSATNEPGLHTLFSFKTSGEEAGLFSPGPTNSWILQDYVEFGLQVGDLSISRIPVGTGSWQLSLPTPQATNVAVVLGLPFALRINEWLATNSAGADLDMLEIYNTTNYPVALGGLVISGKTNTPSTTRPIPALSFIDAQDFFAFTCDSLLGGNGADHLEFRLSSSAGETNTIFWTNRTTIIDRVRYGAQTRDTSMGRLPDGGTNIVFFPTTNYMSLGGRNKYQPITNLLVSELLTHTDPPLEDAIELYNPTAAPLDISRWWISDDADLPQRFRVPANTIIPAGGLKVFYEYAGTGNTNGFNRSGTGNTPDFTLNAAHGGTLYISEGTSTGTLTGFQLTKDFGPAQNGVSFGRYIKSSGGADTVAMSARTFGADNPTTVAQFRSGAGLPNAYPLVGPLVISEIMFRPPDFVVGTNLLDDSLDEFIELQNITSANLPLYDPVYPTNHWRLSGAVDFEFPPNAVVAPNGAILLVNFDPTTNATQLAQFRSLYGVDTGLPIFGPYGGKLNNKSDTIELYKPDPVQLAPHPDAGFVPFVLVEKVKYEDTQPWPTNADGTGFSLQRLSLSGYGNDETNWFGGPPTAGRSNERIMPPEILAHPASQSVSVGATVVFSVTASGTEPITYQWHANAGYLSGESSSTLILFDVQTNQSGIYTVMVTNPGGSVTSVPVTLNVAGAPTLSAPLSLGNGQFQLNLQGVAGRSYRVEASTNLANWLSLGVFSNNGPIQVTDTNAVRFPYRFYRAILLP